MVVAAVVEATRGFLEAGRVIFVLRDAALCLEHELFGDELRRYFLMIKSNFKLRRSAGVQLGLASLRFDRWFELPRLLLVVISQEHGLRKQILADALFKRHANLLVLNCLDVAGLLLHFA